jgi:hypothetical protein
MTRFTDKHDHSGQLNNTIEQGYNNNFWLNSLSYAGKQLAVMRSFNTMLAGV